MVIKLYKLTDERNKLNKDLHDEIILDGYFREESSLLSPSVMVGASNSIIEYNYAYIEELNRYYFINSITIVRTGLYRLDMGVDVLMSYKDEISDLSVIVSDNASSDNMYMSGDVWQTKVKETTSVLNFPSGLLEEGEFILITAGG